MGSVILTAKLIAGYDAVGERNLGQDDPGAAGVLDLDPGPETVPAPRVIQRAGLRWAAMPGTRQWSWPPQSRPSERSRMQLPGASVSLL